MMQLPQPSFSILLLIFSSSILPTVFAFHPSPSFNAAVAPRNIPFSQRYALQNYRPLRKRIGADLEGGWHMSIDNYEMFIPLGFAAAELIRFYTALLTQSQRRAHGREPALSRFHMVVGSLQIAFASTDPIPWDWVTTFTEELVSPPFKLSSPVKSQTIAESSPERCAHGLSMQLEFTHRGFMGAYFIKYWHDDGTIVSVKMALEDEALHRLATMSNPNN